MSPLT